MDAQTLDIVEQHLPGAVDGCGGGRGVTAVETAIDHVQVAMPAGGEEAARAFYGGLLGLREIGKPEHLRRRGGVWFATGSLQLHLGVDRAFRPATKAHIAFRVPDIGAARRALAAAGYAPQEDEPLPGYVRFHVQDPFGNRTEILAPA